MPRYCLLGHVDPTRLEEYREAHRAVWPELLEALRDAGWRNYSLFLRDDGLLIGYAEADDLAVAQDQVARTEVNARWQAAMGDLFQTEGPPTRPGRSFRRCSTSKINFARWLLATREPQR
jgi:L-rhamnose mutarotase